VVLNICVRGVVAGSALPPGSTNGNAHAFAPVAKPVSEKKSR
jgi:hypothetical protein